MIIARSAPHPTLSPGGRGHSVFPRPFGERNKVRGELPLSKGFSLIEVIVTLVVLSIAAMGVLSVFTTGMTGSANPLLISEATELAQEKMDEAIALKKASGFNAVVSDPGGAFPAPFAAFSWSRTVDCVTAADLNTSTGAPPCASGYAHVTITVANTTVGNITLDSLITNY